MTPEMDARIRQALSTRVVGPCEGCGHPAWEIIELVTTPVMTPVFSYVPNPPVVPALIIACMNCGLLRQYSAVRLGLVAPTPSNG